MRCACEVRYGRRQSRIKQMQWHADRVNRYRGAVSDLRAEREEADFGVEIVRVHRSITRIGIGAETKGLTTRA